MATNEDKNLTWDDSMLVVINGQLQAISILKLYELLRTKFITKGSIQDGGGGGSTLDNVELREGGN